MNWIYQEFQLRFGSVKKLLIEGMISGVLLRTYFLRECSAYFCPSEKFSRTPADLFSLLTLTSGLMQILRTSCKPQIPTATPTAAKRGYTSGLNQRLTEAIVWWENGRGRARQREEVNKCGCKREHVEIKGDEFVEKKGCCLCKNCQSDFPTYRGGKDVHNH